MFKQNQAHIHVLSLVAMTALTIRRLDDAIKAQLRIRAAHHGRSMEEEAREILRRALEKEGPRPRNLAHAIRGRFARLGGVELRTPRREPLRQPPDFGG